ncbi:hypothetical protein JCM18916_3635 [Cutibacterium acnes JCM 18916]|nr:hypothetical protein JCM18916_3635 [Cutibacterium acnes JCM 18916]
MALDGADSAVNVGDGLALGDFATRVSPELVNATTDGVVRAPSAFGMTVGSPPSRTATHELVVPRSIPTERAIVGFLLMDECSGTTSP